MSNIRIIDSKDGTIELIGDSLDLKIDSNRKLYTREKGIGSTFKSYKATGESIAQGYNSDEKKEFLVKLYNICVNRVEQIKNERVERDSDDIKDSSSKKIEDETDEVDEE